MVILLEIKFRFSNLGIILYVSAVISLVNTRDHCAVGNASINEVHHVL